MQIPRRCLLKLVNIHNELSIRAWMPAQENKRRTLQSNDVADVIRDEALLISFLKDMVPMETRQDVYLSIICCFSICKNQFFFFFFFFKCCVHFVMELNFFKYRAHLASMLF